jgi:hypothetical protein
VSKRVSGRSGKRGRGKHNTQYSHERGKVLAKQMRAREIEEARNAPAVVVEDKLKGFF